MSQIFYSHVVQPEGSIITVFVPGSSPKSADATHPNYTEIVSRLQADDTDSSVYELFDVAQTVSTKFEKLSERVSVKDGVVYFDGDEVRNSLTNQIIRFLNESVEEERWVALVNFMENVASNPNDHSREQLYNWLDQRDFTITEDGCFVGYKSVRSDFGSWHAGPGIVNGVEVNGHLDNTPGNTVEIARSYVQHDPSVGCHKGLHVGTFEFAYNAYGPVTLKVKVNPRDVVSVPTDCNWAKVRCCRYEVIEQIEDRITSAFDFSSVEDEYDEDGYDEYGYDRDGYDEDGFNADGYDDEGYDRNGLDEEGFNVYGYDDGGYDREGYDADGYDCDGEDSEGYDRDGYNIWGEHRDGSDVDAQDEVEEPTGSESVFARNGI